MVLPLLSPFAPWQARAAEKLGVPATAGKVLGWVGTVLPGLFLASVPLWLVAFGSVVMSRGHGG